eukprot:TRINITY_DN11190_c0_g1_i1.p1 TRINITY_DN11190_c0_g1~~TRINITY_DN11190_c0_g1_i1.p1  ORF type:complete len:120 (+),score=33.86 TRINITY_DN11190_c0_g1_i1:162-521(+)
MLRSLVGSEMCIRDSVKFHHSDATVAREILGSMTHIYMYDRVFSDQTRAELAKLLNECPFRVLVSFKHWREWWKVGLHKLQPVGKLQQASTGKESVTAYFYVNSDFLPVDVTGSLDTSD